MTQPTLFEQIAAFDAVIEEDQEVHRELALRQSGKEVSITYDTPNGGGVLFLGAFSESSDVEAGIRSAVHVIKDADGSNARLDITMGDALLYSGKLPL